MDRRRFLRYAAGTSMSGFAALQGFSMDCSRAEVVEAGEGSYGPLQAACPDLALPPGFQYRKFGVTGSRMSDGLPTPAAHDGMAAFPLPNGNIRLIRNHEIGYRDAGTPVAQPVYDPRAGGGTTSLEIDPATREVVRDFVSLSGTAVNCAGGPTPWGSWLSCEETVAGPPQMQRKHGYVFEVPVTADGPVEPIPLKPMGRFEHEAAAVDPTTGVVYLTEDQFRAGFYRFLPERPHQGGRQGDLSAGGELQMLAVDGRPNFDTGHNQVVGVGLEVRWVTIEDPDPADAQENVHAVFDQGWRQGAAEFSRVEGCFYADGAVYFSCTDGGDAVTAPMKGLMKMARDIASTLISNLSSDGVVFGRSMLRSIQMTYERMAKEIIQRYYNDSMVNGLTFHRHEEAEAVEAFSHALEVASKEFDSDVFESPQIPNWNRVNSALPSFGEELIEAVEADMKD